MLVRGSDELAPTIPSTQPWRRHHVRNGRKAVPNDNDPPAVGPLGNLKSAGFVRLQRASTYTARFFKVNIVFAKMKFRDGRPFRDSSRDACTNGS